MAKSYRIADGCKSSECDDAKEKSLTDAEKMSSPQLQPKQRRKSGCKPTNCTDAEKMSSPQPQPKRGSAHKRTKCKIDESECKSPKCTDAECAQHDTKDEKICVPPPAITQQKIPTSVDITTRKNIKTEWYQTPSHITYTILIKGTSKEFTKIDITARELNIFTETLDGTKFSQNIKLYNEIVPAMSSFENLSMKIDIKLRKSYDEQWPNLEAVAPLMKDCIKESDCIDSDIPPPCIPPPCIEGKVPIATLKVGDCNNVYTSSKPGKKLDWDKVAKECDADEEDDPNKMFKKMYTDSDEDARRAMMKSLSESNGTVLSTNWKEVGSRKGIKPYASPDDEMRNMDRDFARDYTQ